MSLGVTTTERPYVPQTRWVKTAYTPTPFALAMQEVVLAIFLARNASIALCTAKFNGLPLAGLREAAGLFHAKLDIALLKAYEVAGNFSEKQRVYRSALPGSKAEEVIFQKMAEMAWH